MNINYEHYKVFYHVANEGSITLAAQTLFISQPAVSKAIQVLEKELDCELFMRHKNGMTLTAEGRMLFFHISQAVDAITLAENRLVEMLNQKDNTLRLGTSDMVARYFLPPYLENFHQTYPHFCIDMHSDSADAIISALRDGITDLGIIALNQDIPADLKTIPGNNYQITLVAGPQYAFLKEKTLSFSDIIRYPLICTNAWIPTLNSTLNADIKPAYVLETVDLVLSYTMHNLGIGILIREFIDKPLANGAIFELSVNFDTPCLEYCAVIRRHSILPKAAKLFLEELKSVTS